MSFSGFVEAIVESERHFTVIEIWSRVIWIDIRLEMLYSNKGSVYPTNIIPA